MPTLLSSTSDEASFSLKASHVLLALFFAPALVLLTSYMFSLVEKKPRKWGVPVKVPGEGLAYRHARFLTLLETPFPGGDTVASLFELAAKKYASSDFLGTRKLEKRETEKDPHSGREFEKLSLGEYRWQTFEQVFARVSNFSSGLISLGHAEQSRVAIFAETRAEWHIGLQGCFRQSLTVVTVYASLGEEALVHSLNETEVTTVICDSKQLEKIVSVGSRLRSVERVIYMSEQLQDVAVPPNVPSTWKVIQFEEVEKLGEKHPSVPRLPKPQDTAVIMYTSGSTGVPKGVMMSHGNLVATIAGVFAMVPDAGPKDTYLAYLPLAHVLELAAEVGMASIGAKVGYSSPLTLIDSSSKVKKGTKGDAPTLSPTLFAAVPAILDRIRDGVQKKIESSSSMVQSLFHLAYSRKLAAMEGRTNTVTYLESLTWDTLVFRKVRSAVGGKVRFLLSGGAPLSADTQRFMNICFGCPVGQGYGLTETCAGGTFTESLDLSVGRVGPPIPCTYIKLMDWEEGGYRIGDKPNPRGEICIGGPSVTQGYFKNPEKTAQDYKEDEEGTRWFHTGDIGVIHPDGCLQIIDRKKDIVKLQAGEYVSLGKVEAVLQVSPVVDNVMMYAESSKDFAVALVVPHRDALLDWAKSESSLNNLDFVELCTRKEAEDAVSKFLAKAAKEAKLEKFEVPRRVKLLPEQWTPESGLVTAALKLKREQIRSAFSKELEDLYK